ncbi:MAG: cytochrome c biogenesis protein CcsA [Planctomycetes bacterium]|nr:cytochrome c biogenesis protein CcsA [Planctomycetota bacterium]
MLIPLGQLALYLALLLGVMAVVLLTVGTFRRDSLAARIGREALIGSTAMVLATAAVLVVALVRCDFRLQYVFQYGSLSQPLVYRISALWAGESGSLLTWTALTLLALTSFVVSRPLTRKVAAVGALAALLPLLLLVILTVESRPFATIPLQTPTLQAADPAPSTETYVYQVPPNGRELKLQLQTWAMIVHPPLLFAGYAVLVVPFAIALANLLGDRLADRLDVLRRYLLVGWTLLTAGIALGAYWAYVELGWGGYWAWDPVENASLVPWLLATAALHTLTVSRRSGRLLRTTLILTIASLLTCVLATYITRGGIEESLHAFAKGELTQCYLYFALAAIAAATVSLVGAWPGKADGDRPAPSRRVWLMVVVAAVLTAFAAAVFLGTVGPQVLSGLGGPRYQISIEDWNILGAVFGLLMLGVMIAGPWLTGGLRAKGNRVAPLVAHASYVLLVVAVAGSHIVRDDLTAWFAKGQSADLAGHQFTYEGVTVSDDAQRSIETIRAAVTVSRNGRTVAHLSPAHKFNYRTGDQRAEVDLTVGPLQDLYVSLDPRMGPDGEALLSVHRTGLVVWLWGATGLMTLAGLAAAWRRSATPGGEQP